MLQSVMKHRPIEILIDQDAEGRNGATKRGKKNTKHD